MPSLYAPLPIFWTCVSGFRLVQTRKTGLIEGMSTIYEKITADLKAAMMERNTAAMDALRGLKAALLNAQVAKGNVHEELPETEVFNVVRKLIKQREEAREIYEKAGRTELAAAEKAQAEVLATLLPAEMTEVETERIVDAVIAELGATTKKDMGRVMKELRQRTEGRAPGKLLSALVSRRLS